MCGVQVTSGSLVAKILSSKAPLKTLAISNGTLVVEMVAVVKVALALRDVSTTGSGCKLLSAQLDSDALVITNQVNHTSACTGMFDNLSVAGRYTGA
jgi:hypothetical protein